MNCIDLNRLSILAVPLLLASVVLSQNNCVQLAKLTAGDAAPDDYFGSVAISGDTILVGAHGDDHLNGPVDAGSAYVFVWNGAIWMQQAVLTAGNAANGDGLGLRVAVDGDTAVVGANQDDHSTFVDAGSAYVFARSGSTWSQQGLLVANDAADGDECGYSVAISGDTAIIGAYLDDNANGIDAGAAYVFIRSGTAWIQEAKLTALSGVADDEFGSSVSIDGDTAVVGSPGTAAYVFVRSGTNWTEQGILVGSDAVPSQDYYAWQVAVCGDTIAVSSPEDDHSGLSGAGSAYVFVRAGTAWAEQAILRASDAAASDELGESIACWDDTIVVGSGISGAGSAYVFTRNGTTWPEQKKLVTSVPSSTDLFGWSVSVWEGTCIVGAAFDDHTGGIDAGSAYVFSLGVTPAIYCTAKTSSAGCVTLISASDLAVQPVSGAGDYSVTASQVQGKKNGLVFGGNMGITTLPFSGGTLCVQPPLRRGPIRFSAGSTVMSCDGAFSTIVNTGTQFPTGLDAGPGGTAWYQYWYRDPNNGAGNLGTALSNGLQLAFL